MDFRIKDYFSPILLTKTYFRMKRTPRLSKEKIEQVTLENLKNICVYANEHVPYYKKLFKSIDFDPETLSSFEEFERIPTLDKSIIRDNFDELLSDEYQKLSPVICETSGSTGTPLQFYLDKGINAATFVLFHRTWSMAPWHIGLAQATISGYAEGEWHYSRLRKILYLSSFHLDNKTIHTFYDLIKKYKVRFLRGYPSSLYRMAQLLVEENLELHFDVLFSGAETLLPYQREFIEKVFSGKVIDHFTHWERTASICECLNGHLHAENDYGYHEIVDDDGKKTMDVGRLVCTGLYNRAMPLIRYDTRDLAQWDSETATCSCGSNFPIVKKIIGRIEDFVVLPNGRYIGRLDAAFKYNENIRYAFLYQPDLHNLEVNLCPGDNFDFEYEKVRLESELRKRVGNEIKLNYKIVEEEEIPFSPVGKLRFMKSDVLAQEQITNQEEI
ncbi:MAG: phenylacetate--CoA ligase family protein [Saccharofermentanales bacterium]|jgi:phenylacetate-CoA ligase